MLQVAIPEFVLSDLESAERAGVIEISGGRLRFSHPLLASTHYANTPVSRRRELHRRLATVIDDEEERAQHLALGAEAPDCHTADTLEKAAGVAARRGATESAAQLLEDAARLTPMDEAEAWTARIIAAAEHRFSSGEASRARHVLEELIPDLPAGALRARARLQLAQVLGDEPMLAMELLEQALADAKDDDRWRVEIECELAAVASNTGQLAVGRTYAESAVQTAERLAEPILVAKTLGLFLVTFVCNFGEGVPWLVWLNARYAFDRGDLGAARKEAEYGISLAERTGNRTQTLSLMPLLAGIELLSGEAAAAHARLKDLREFLLSRGFGPAGSYSKALVWSQDVEALIAMGRLDEARDVSAELRSRAEASGSPDVDALACRCEGLVLAARGDLSAAIEAIDTALITYAHCHRPLEHGRTLLEKGSIERRAKRKAAAKQSLEAALAILEPLGAQLWVSRARDELSRIGLRQARATKGLTPAQARVAELVAAGLTNPQIARQLNMSLRTVESHLSRVFREYGVGSRSQLVGVLVASDGRIRTEPAPGEQAIDDGLSQVS